MPSVNPKTVKSPRTMATSFISEHSAEYILVPELARILAKQFSRVIPIYFLSTREGSIISRECSPSQIVRIVSVFARRPKVNAPNQPFVEVKFNESLLEIAELSIPLGIATFAGVPLASSIIDLRLGIDSAWFELTGADGDVVYELSLKGELLSRKSPKIVGPLSEDKLVESIFRTSRSMRWNDAIENLRTIRRGAGSPESTWYPFGGGIIHSTCCWWTEVSSDYRPLFSAFLSYFAQR